MFPPWHAMLFYVLIPQYYHLYLHIEMIGDANKNTLVLQEAFLIHLYGLKSLCS